MECFVPNTFYLFVRLMYLCIGKVFVYNLNVGNIANSIYAIKTTKF